MFRIFPRLCKVLFFIVILLKRGRLYRSNTAVLTHVLENARHHNLFLLLPDLIHGGEWWLLRDRLTPVNIVKWLVLLRLNEGVSLKNFIDPLLNHPHVNEHIALSDPLMPKKVLIDLIITLNHK